MDNIVGYVVWHHFVPSGIPHWLHHTLGTCEYIFRTIELPLYERVPLDLNEDSLGHFSYVLWGVTLSMTNNLLLKTGYESIDFPPLLMNNRLFNIFLIPLMRKFHQPLRLSAKL